MFVPYPKTVTANDPVFALVDYKDYFTEEELSALFLLSLSGRGWLMENLRFFRLQKSSRDPLL